MQSAANTLAETASYQRLPSLRSRVENSASKSAARLGFFDHIIFRYGLALGSVAGATALGFFANRCHLHELVFTFFVLAAALTSWLAGAWPAIVALVFASLFMLPCPSPEDSADELSETHFVG